MAEDALQNLEKQLKSYLELSRRIVRRWWLIGIFTVLGAGISITVAVNMTWIYQSRSLIAFQEVQDRAAFTGQEVRRPENWLRTRLEETLSSHTFLLTMMRKLDLFPEMRKAVAPEEVLQLCRQRIQFGMVGEDSFWISFDYKIPEKSRQAVAYMAEHFIQKNVHDAVSAAQGTLSFIEAEVKKTQQEMKIMERGLARFVGDHPEYRVLPGGGAAQPTPVAPREDPRASYISVSSPELKQALSKKGSLQAQLQVLMNPRGDTRLTLAKQEVDRALSRVAALRRKYTELHPDVQGAQQYLRQAQVQLRFAEAGARGNSSSITSLRAEIDEIDQTIASLSRPKRRKTEESAPAAPAPIARQLTKKAQLEQEWSSLTRDREVTKSKYEELQVRLTRAKMSANLERKRAESQFTIVDRANLPGKPIRPSRSKLAMAGTALGFMLGMAIAVLLVIFDSRIYNQQDLLKVCDLPILAQIPRES